MACSGTALAFLTIVIKNTNKIQDGNVAKTIGLADRQRHSVIAINVCRSVNVRKSEFGVRNSI
jgi:hypothetical protein